jgi:glucose-6-phosphate-specific signal transduction histidine kinase
MSLPNLSNTVLRFAQNTTKRAVTQTVVNHVPQLTKVDTTIKATITTPQPEDLQNIEVDTSLKYKLCHSVDELTINDRFIHNSIEYKVIAESNRSDYGYYRVVGEEVQE